MAISATVLADSINEQGNRITTFIITFPRIVLAEFNTHRMLSRNSASSRAIPFRKMLQMVEEDPFIPIKWMKDHKGMQGTEYYAEDEVTKLHLRERWLRGRDEAVLAAKALALDGVTKQVVNRMLEPYMWHTALVTATEWQNYFALRAHKDAEIHIQDLAYKMLDEYNTSIPKLLRPGEWHIPFGDQIDDHRVLETFKDQIFPCDPSTSMWENIEPYLLKISTARCARVSYLNFEGKDDYDADIKLHNQLLFSGHWSPFEHCAKAMTHQDIQMSSFNADDGYNGTWGWSGNLKGFVQYRKFFGEENKTDSRIKK